MTTDSRIHRCPFCRGADRLYLAVIDDRPPHPDFSGPIHISRYKAHVYCANCWAAGPLADSDEKAIERWNATADRCDTLDAGDRVELVNDLVDEHDGRIFLGAGSHGCITFYDPRLTYFPYLVLFDGEKVERWMAGEDLFPIANYQMS